MRHDAWFFIGIFVFIFLIWAATGGPNHPISFAGPLLSAPEPIGTGTYIHLPSAPFSIGTSDIELSGSSNGESSGSIESGSGNQSTTPPPLSGVSFGPPSNYRGLVTLSHYVSGAGGDPQSEYVTIELSSSAKAPVDISGWQLESAASGSVVTIPQGTEVPTSGIIEAVQDIILNPGDQAIVITGQSPIGASFRENECIGYFAEYQTFSPPLPDSCPDPSDELQQFYGPNYIRDAACQTYVNTLSRCTVAISPPAGMTSACDSFLENYLNYNGCVVAHQNDADFKGKTWRVYLERDTPLWRTQYEVVELLDSSGKTVDEFAY